MTITARTCQRRRKTRSPFPRPDPSRPPDPSPDPSGAAESAHKSPRFRRSGGTRGPSRRRTAWRGPCLSTGEWRRTAATATKESGFNWPKGPIGHKAPLTTTHLIASDIYLIQQIRMAVIPRDDAPARDASHGVKESPVAQTRRGTCGEERLGWGSIRIQLASNWHPIK